LNQLCGEVDVLDSIPGLQHHHAVPADHHHSDLVLRLLLGELDGIVQHEVHEGVEPAQGALHLPAAVDPEVDPLVHELLELRWVGLRHPGAGALLKKVNQA